MRAILASALACFVGCGGGVVEYVYVTGDGGAAASSSDTRDGGAAQPEGSSAWATSGQRLRAIVWRTADGAEQHSGWWLDSARSEECSFRIAMDGRERCLPQPFVLHGPRAPGGLFTDPNCQKPIVGRRVLPGCATNAPEIRYVVLGSPSRTLHAVGPRTYPPAVWTATDTGVCVPETSTDVEYFDVGPEVPPSEFVEASAVVEPATSRLTYLTRVGSDGSRARLRAYDEELGTSCFPAVATDDLLRCGPWTTANVLQGMFVDPTCETPAVSCSSAACGAPVSPDRVAYATRASMELTQTRHTFFRIAPLPSSPAPAFRMEAGACVQSGTHTSYRGVALEELAASAMVPLAATFEATPTRLRRRVFEALGAVYGVADVFRDTALDTTCRAEPTGDGATRCVPELTDTATYFLDDACTSEPVVTYTGGKYRWARVFDTAGIVAGCNGHPRLHAITTTLVHVSSVYRLVDGSGAVTCARQDLPTTTALARVGADVTDTLERFERITK